MTVEMKFGLVSTVETENPNGEFDVVLSAPTLDRDGEIIDTRAFEPLPDHINFDTDHSMTVDSVVGSGVPYYDESGNLRVKGTFASTARAQEVRTLVSEGHIRTTSVTFMGAKRAQDEKGVPHIKTAELLNGTFTPIPSNREAVVVSAKALGAVVDEKVGARNSAKDAEAIQSMHDASVGLGAACAAKSASSVSAKAMSRLDAKAIIGSVEALQQRVVDALEDAYARYTYLRGVLPDTVVFDTYDDNYDRVTYRQSYTDDGSVVTLTGAPVEVDVMEVVLPDADADRETDEALKAADRTDVETAEAAATSAKSADDPLPARFALSENAALFAFGAP